MIIGSMSCLPSTRVKLQESKSDYADIMALMEQVQISIMEQEKTLDSLDKALQNQQMQITRIERRMQEFENKLAQLSEPQHNTTDSAFEVPPHY